MERGRRQGLLSAMALPGDAPVTGRPARGRGSRRAQAASLKTAREHWQRQENPWARAHASAARTGRWPPSGLLVLVLAARNHRSDGRHGTVGRAAGLGGRSVLLGFLGHLLVALFFGHKFSRYRLEIRLVEVMVSDKSARWNDARRQPDARPRRTCRAFACRPEPRARTAALKGLSTRQKNAGRAQARPDFGATTGRCALR